ncbi:MAG: peptide ABC transporter substrate-binding protein [Acidobacteria bacterium]|nr:MAG: peptide ABC transporter substrate-binding protein [Acidobacteriota bacterium]REK02389.1 MAG: peptide ABC transporter substrate-binding protein [Acidobacteriota bacterium]REK13810.1 MAG: peptide ABC transporter substrate-binding protein [Acidobacteriota bacterium]REK41804.1 MAG: peptide ABC transporter substrate-binding protein [Acidobacteriota bacterium]
MTITWNRTGRFARSTSVALLIWSVLFSVGCSQLENPRAEDFYSETIPPVKQEFRWSNGRLPKSFDPKDAAAPPETDIVRAIYEGLTEIDPKTLNAVPGIAVKWESSEKGKEWTFELRKDAVWTNGEKVTADDFVRSWKRLAKNGDQTAHFSHISNIKGFGSREMLAEVAHAESISKNIDPLAKPGTLKARSFQEGEEEQRNEGEKPAEDNFGAVAVDEFTLTVRLKKPDNQFPKLVAHPVLRPVYGDGEALIGDPLRSDAVTNGAFVVSRVGEDGVELEKSETYFAKESVALKKISLVVAKDADSALSDYKAGRVDAVTNTEFEPLALKLLTPYVDFRRTTYSALNFYEFNRKSEPFNDRRVREALAIAIDRKRLTEDLTSGAMQPAYGFLPFDEQGSAEKLKEDVDRAKDLLRKAGFPGGKDFPQIRLVINRNDLQQKIAKEVASMWKENLGIQTEIVVRELEEMEEVRGSGEFDLIRRGAVLPTSDETANMLAIFKKSNSDPAEEENEDEDEPADSSGSSIVIPDMPPPIPDPNLGLSEFDGLPPSVSDELTVDVPGEEKPILTEEAALFEVPAIPLYFPTSYSLVKPYVSGFDINALDAPLLRAVRIDNSWRPGGSGAIGR